MRLALVGAQLHVRHARDRKKEAWLSSIVLELKVGVAVGAGLNFEVVDDSATLLVTCKGSGMHFSGLWVEEGVGLGIELGAVEEVAAVEVARNFDS